MMPSGLLQTAAAGNCQIRLPLISRKYSTALRLQISAERRCTPPRQISGKYDDGRKDWFTGRGLLSCLVEQEHSGCGGSDLCADPSVCT